MYLIKREFIILRIKGIVIFGNSHVMIFKSPRSTTHHLCVCHIFEHSNMNLVIGESICYQFIYPFVLLNGSITRPYTRWVEFIIATASSPSNITQYEVRGNPLPISFFKIIFVNNRKFIFKHLFQLRKWLWLISHIWYPIHSEALYFRVL